MNTQLTTIDFDLLDRVTGGSGNDTPPPAPSPTNKDSSKGGGGISLDILGKGGGSASGGGESSKERTDYGLCVDAVREMGGKPQDIVNTCGMPPR